MEMADSDQATGGSRGWSGPDVNRRVKILASLFVVSFALDFKGSPGGTPFQYGMAIVNCAAFLWLAIEYRLSFPFSGRAGLTFWIWIAFLLMGSITAFENGVLMGHFVRTIYPFVLFAEGLLVALWVGRNTEWAMTLISAMTWAGIVACVFTVWWGFHFSGLRLDTIRYQILSPLIPFILAVGIFDLFVARHRRLLALTMLLFVGAVIVISVTRGMFLVIGAIGLGLLVARASCIKSRAFSVSRGWVRAGVFGLGVVALILALTAMFAPDLWTRWVTRSFGAYHATSLWMRVAAAADQWNQLVAGLASLLLGKGFGHSYHYSAAYSTIIGSYWQLGHMNAPMWYPGEFMWVTPLFYAGVVIGTVVSAILLLGLLNAVRKMSVLMCTQDWSREAVRPLWVGSMAYIAFMGNSFTANPFIFRQSALFVGLTLGLTYAMNSITSRDNISSGSKLDEEAVEDARVTAARRLL